MAEFQKGGVIPSGKVYVLTEHGCTFTAEVGGLTAAVQKAIRNNWYRLSRYEDPDQAGEAIANVACEVIEAARPWLRGPGG